MTSTISIVLVTSEKYTIWQNINAIDDDDDDYILNNTDPEDPQGKNEVFWAWGDTFV